MMRSSAFAATALICSVPAVAGTTPFDLDFHKYSDTTVSVGTLAPDSFGDRDGGRHFDDTSFIKNNIYAHSFTFSQDSLSTTIEGGVIRPRDNDGSGSSNATYQGGDEGVYVGRFYGGLGVGWEINPYDLDDDQHTADNKRGTDFLVLDFNQVVEVKELEFNYYGSVLKKYGSNYSRTEYDYVDVEVFTRVFENGGFQDTHVGSYRIDDDTDTIDLGDKGVEGQTFVISPSNSGEWIKINGKWYKEKYEYFKLRGIAGHYTPGGGGGGGVVPTPSAALAAVAMLGFTAARRRRRK